MGFIELFTCCITENNRPQEQNDEVFELADRRGKIDQDLAYKRSFFVRMVSDPKIYNPKIAVATPTSRRPTCLASSAEEEEEGEGEGTTEQGSYTPTWVLNGLR